MFMKTREVGFRTIGDLQICPTLINVRLKITCNIVCSAGISELIWLWDAGEILLWDNNKMISI